MINTITQLDLLVSKQAVLLQTPVLNKVMLLITNIGGAVCLGVLSALVFTFLVYKKRWRQALFFGISMVGALILELLLKILVHRIRPENTLIREVGYSFPSGHATMALVFFFLLIYLFKEDIKSQVWKHVFVISCIVLTLLVGFSRIYLNVHWLTDVIGGFALGLFWLMLMILIFKMKHSEKPASEQGKTL